MSKLVTYRDSVLALQIVCCVGGLAELRKCNIIVIFMVKFIGKHGLD